MDQDWVGGRAINVTLARSTAAACIYGSGSIVVNNNDSYCLVVFSAMASWTPRGGVEAIQRVSVRNAIK